MKSSAAPLLTPEEQATITAALPSIREAAPDAANIIVRLLDNAAAREMAPEQRYASIAEVATSFDVTQQTIRNWADRGWLPCNRTPAGTRRIPRSVLASSQALSRPSPVPPDLSRSQIESILNAPRRSR
jgi:hypothetical protein